MSFSSPAQFSSGLIFNAVNLTIDENGLGSGVTKVEFFDGTLKIGEDTGSPYTLSWVPNTRGACSQTAVAWKGNTPTYTAFTLFLAEDYRIPTITTGQKDQGVVNMPYAYQIAAGGPPTSYTLASGSLPSGVSLNPSTDVLSGTPTEPGTFTPAITATNLKGASSPVVITLTISATPRLVIYEPFNYSLGTNNPNPAAAEGVRPRWRLS